MTETVIENMDTDHLFFDDSLALRDEMVKLKMFDNLPDRGQRNTVNDNSPLQKNFGSEI